MTEITRRGVLLIVLKSPEETSYGHPLLLDIKTLSSNIDTFDVDNQSDAMVVQMAEKFIQAINESILVIVDRGENLELNGINRLLANLSRATKKPSQTVYLGQNQDVMRFTNWLSMVQVSSEVALRKKVMEWANE